MQLLTTVAVVLWLVSTAAAGAAATPSASAGQEQPRVDPELARGYASLYEIVSTLRHANKVFLIKFEPDDLQAITDDVSDTLTKVTRRLEEMAAGEPGFDLEDTGTPRFANEARKAMSRARIESFAPLVGKTGKDFERTLLLTQAGQLNQALYLSKVLAEAEPIAARKQYLEEIHGQFGELYRQVNKLLDKDYYCSGAPRDSSD